MTWNRCGRSSVSSVFSVLAAMATCVVLAWAGIALGQAAAGGDREVIFSDDFSKSADGNGPGKPSDRWTSFAGDWTVEGGVLHESSPSYDLGLVVCDLYLCCDYRLETKVRLVEGGEGAGLYWDVLDAQTGENGNMARSDGEGPLMYGSMDGRNFNCVGFAKGTKLKDKQWHTVRLDVRNSDGSFDLYWDGEKIVDNAKAARREGYVGLQASMGKFEFDDVTVSVAKGTDWARQPRGRVAPEWCLPTARAASGDAVYPRWNKNLVQVVTAGGLFVREIGEPGDGRDQFNLPTAAAVGKDGRIYVAEAGNNRVQVFDAEGHSLKMLRIDGAGSLNAPSGVAVDEKGRVWIVDNGNNRLVCLEETGKVLATIGSAGEAPGQFKRPGQVTLIDGRLYVADSGNHRIQVFDPEKPAARPEVIPTDPAMEPCSVACVGGLFVVTTWRGTSTYDRNWKHLQDFSGRAFKGPWPHMATFDAEGRLVPPKVDPEEAKAAAFKHFVPANKKLSEAWVKGLYEKGPPRTYWGRDLDTIAMPVGGICAGQLYLKGDGTLDCWRLFFRNPATQIGQGFALLRQTPQGVVEKKLNRQDFPTATFRGEYPVGTVTYREEGAPVQVKMEAFSPFIPLDAADSTLPATMFRITMKNVSDKPVRASIVGWLDNGVLVHSRKRVVGVKHTVVERLPEGTVVLHTAGEWAPSGAAPRADVLLADFEGDDYRGWTATGTAFGTKPASGRAATAGSFVGKGLVDTFIPAGDAPQGTLTSPEFTIERPFINFLIAGGAQENVTCINLLVEGKVARTTAGDNTEALKPRSFDVTSLVGRKAKLQIVDASSGGWGHIMIDDVKLSDVPAKSDIKDLSDQGSLAWALAGPAESAEKLQADLAAAKPADPSITAAKEEQYPLADTRNSALAAPMEDLAPGAERTYLFVLAWDFPFRPQGKAYAERFADAAAVAKHVLERQAALANQTLRWRDTYYDSTIPTWLLDRLAAPVSCLATDTCEQWKGGRFWAWEGCVCCEGTCTHVWNYEHALARLFPDLERSAREKQDLGAGFQPTGLVGFRGEGSGYAADGQCGTVLKCYREHQTSADAEFLKRNWPKIKKVLEFMIARDANDDGIIEDAQPNTYDIEFFGPNTFTGSLYLAALRAGEEMAAEMGDAEFAARCRKIFQSGSKITAEKLFNGEYYVQQVDLKAHPGNQYADGCLADQLFGEGWARQVGLGPIYPREQVRKALQSIWKYNWAPDTGPQNAMHGPERWFVRGQGESGLFICTWPKSPHMEGASVRYRDEAWTGIEYQVAGNMVWEGMTDEAMAILRAVDDRFQPARKRNPFDEYECGDHYARAMASWGVFTALSGFEYHGPKGHIGFAPRLTPENFRAAFTAAEGWGTFSQKRDGKTQSDRIEVRWGKLRVKTLALSLPAGATAATVKLTAAGKDVPVTQTLKDGRLEITLGQEVALTEGQALEVTIQ